VRNPEEKPDALVTKQLAPGGRIDQIAALAQSMPTMPLTLQVGPEMLESWNVIARSDPEYAPGFARLKAAMQRATNQLLPAPYVPTAAPSLGAAGLGGEWPDARPPASAAPNDVPGAPPDPRPPFTAPADAASLARIQGLLVERIGISSASV